MCNLHKSTLIGILHVWYIHLSMRPQGRKIVCFGELWAIGQALEKRTSGGVAISANTRLIHTTEVNRDHRRSLGHELSLDHPPKKLAPKHRI